MFTQLFTLGLLLTEAEEGHRKKRKEIGKKESKSRKKKRNREKRKKIRKKESKSRKKKVNREKRK